MHHALGNDGGETLLVLGAEQLELQLVLDAEEEVVEVTVSFIHLGELLVGRGRQHGNRLQCLLLELGVRFVESFHGVFVVVESDGEHVLGRGAAHDAHKGQAEAVQVEVLEHFVVAFVGRLGVCSAGHRVGGRGGGRGEGGRQHGLNGLVRWNRVVVHEEIVVLVANEGKTRRPCRGASAFEEEHVIETVQQLLVLEGKVGEKRDECEVHGECVLLHGVADVQVHQELRHLAK